jgi:DNA-binding NarL/FixJ family response regulator
MGHTAIRLHVGIVAGDVSVRNELARVSRLAGHRVTVARAGTPTMSGQLNECDVAILAGSADRQLAAIRRFAPALSVIAVLPTVDRRATSTLLRHGVAGIVAQTDIETTLSPTILAVACGQLCVPRAYAAQAERPQLSTREKQVLGMVVLGFANIEIAQRLVVAESTVKSHLNSAFRKLGVRTRVEATALILNPANGLGTGILTIPTAASDAPSSSV